jgi:acyl-CoA synthetase (AMP-forming)/AMP-acid ligase II
MPPETLAKLRAAMPRLRVQLMYGLTECKRVSIMPVDEDLRRPGACGRPLPGTEVFVVDEDGKSLPPGQVGEFIVRGRHVMAGYWRREELTRQRFIRVDGPCSVLRTGDYGWMDFDGYLYVEGRRDDVYKERGFRVSATEIEAAAHAVDGVRLAAVIPPRSDSPRSHAVLIMVGELSAEQVMDELRHRIEHFKIPRRCVVVDAIPLNHNGKVDKKALAKYVDDGCRTEARPAVRPGRRPLRSRARGHRGHVELI